MPQIVRTVAAGSFALASLATLPGCPLLLEDNFTLASSEVGGAGGGSCGISCGQTDAGRVGAAGAGGRPNPSPPPDDGGASAPTDGGAGSGGEPPGPDAGPPDCWVLGLYDSTHSATAYGNCLGIHGWNQLETDPNSSTSVTVSYQNGDVCFAGTIDNTGWGAVYNFTFANANPWNASSRGVGGLELAFSGSTLPPRIKLVYSEKDLATTGLRDYCTMITPAALVNVPFSATHPNCDSTSPGTTTPDPTRLTHLRLALPASTTDYSVNYCLEIRAVP